MPDPGSTWPIVGREAELRSLREVIERRGAVVIAGEAGVGKSRVARELVSRIAGRSGAGFAFASESAREVPLAPFAPWLDAVPDPPDASIVQQVVTALTAPGPDWVLCVDDAHLLDAVSAAVLRQLAEDRAVRLVVTLRTGVLAPDAVTALWKDELAPRFELPPLSAQHTRELLHAVLGGPVDVGSEQRLHTISGGNALWLRHLVEAERAAGRLTRVVGEWRLTTAPAISPALEDLVAGRIGRLSETQQRALELLAFGEPLGLAMLHRLVEPEAVEELEERGLISLEVDGERTELRLAHPIYGEVVRARIPALRARRLRGELAVALGATGGRRSGDDLRRAVVALGGDSPLDAGTLLRAATQAVALTDAHLAERLFRAALDAGGGFEASIGLAQLLSWLMRPDEAEVELARATEVAADDVERANAAATRVGLLHFVLDRPDEARRVLAEAEARGEAEDASPPARADLRAMAALLDTVENRLEEGRALASTVLTVDSPPLARTLASYAAGTARAFSGHGPAVADLVEEGLAAARFTADAATWQLNLGYVQVLDGALRAEFADARTRIAWLRQQPGPFAAPFAAMYEARVAWETGRPATAERLIESLVGYFPGSGGGWSRMFQMIVAGARAMLGDIAGSRAALERADEVAHSGVLLFEAEVDLARALLAAAEGKLVEATDRAGRAAAAARSCGQFAVEVVARHTAVSLGDRGQLARLTELTGIVDGRRAPAARAHAAALGARDVDGLLAVSRDLEAIELEVFAAEAAAQAAVLARAGGRLADATAASSRAAELAQRCEGARTPALAASLSPLPISDREREVIHHAARGLTNRQIAEQLHVSVRTVESHVYRACTRLGLSDRAALVAAVVPTRAVNGSTDGAPTAPSGMQ